MSLGSRILAALAKLPAAQTHDVTVERDLDAKMADGVVLLADRWFPSQPTGGHPPIVLLRSPYGRRQLGVLGRLFAERGYQAVIQSCRGTFGSGGEWEPFKNERADGQATLQWLADQPWFSGTVGTFGPSYLGLTQWAVTDDPPEFLRAMAPSVTATDIRKAVIYPGDAFSLETSLNWLYQLEYQELSPLRVLRSMAASQRALKPAAGTLPVSEADRVAVGHHVAFFQDWLGHEEPDDPWWEPVRFGHDLTAVPPTSLLGGWYDLFLPAQIADYEALVAAGRPARLTIGPWSHVSPGGMAAAVRDGLEWFDAHLPAPTRGRIRNQPVRIFVMGSRRWVDLPGWPPPADAQRWHLHAGGRLDPSAPGSAPPDRYRYDPADPTPGIGGPSLDRKNAGPKDQRRREARPDVLTYTSAPMVEDLTVAGPLAADLHLRSSVEHADVVVCLCEVSPKGRSKNLSHGVIRLRPGDVELSADGSFRIRVAMWPTANTFRKGCRIRLQVSSGAHPLFVRNPGTGEPLITATTLKTAECEVFHDPDHPSALELPVSRI